MKPDREVEMKLEMLAPMRATNRVLFTPGPDGATARSVTWRMDGANGFVGKALALVDGHGHDGRRSVRERPGGAEDRWPSAETARAELRARSHPSQEIPMARYVDGFVLPIPKRNAAAYRRIARKAGKIWREHGALEYRECVGRRREARQAHLVPAERQAEARRGRVVLVDRVQVARGIATA